jgi:hypothetical protein
MIYVDERRMLIIIALNQQASFAEVLMVLIDEKNTWTSVTVVAVMYILKY